MWCGLPFEITETSTTLYSNLILVHRWSHLEHTMAQPRSHLDSIWCADTSWRAHVGFMFLSHQRQLCFTRIAHCCQSGFTLRSLWRHFDFTLLALRTHVALAAAWLRLRSDVTLMVLAALTNSLQSRSEFDSTSIFFHVGFTSSAFRSHSSSLFPLSFFLSLSLSLALAYKTDGVLGESIRRFTEAKASKKVAKGHPTHTKRSLRSPSHPKATPGVWRASQKWPRDLTGMVFKNGLKLKTTKFPMNRLRNDQDSPLLLSLNWGSSVKLWMWDSPLCWWRRPAGPFKKCPPNEDSIFLTEQVPVKTN